MLQIGFHPLILRLSCTMAGIIVRRDGIQQLGGMGELFIQGKLGKMEAADQNVGGKPFCNVNDSFVGTAADQYALSFFVDEQILLVAKIVGDESVADSLGKSTAAKAIGTIAVIAIVECKCLVYGKLTAY